MGNIETKLGDNIRKQWFVDNPKSYPVETRPVTWQERDTMIYWLRENVNGNAIPRFIMNRTDSDNVTLEWNFTEEEDAVHFKMVWGLI